MSRPSSSGHLTASVPIVLQIDVASATAELLVTLRFHVFALAFATMRWGDAAVLLEAGARVA